MPEHLKGLPKLRRRCSRSPRVNSIRTLENINMTKPAYIPALTAVALIFSLTSAAWAQQPASGAQEPPQAQRSQPVANQGPMTLRRVFDRADQNGDGRLTRREAKGWLPITYESFEQIDTDRLGSISFDQFVAFTNERMKGNLTDYIITQQF
jgi:hypothetical protein